MTSPVSRMGQPFRLTVGSVVIAVANYLAYLSIDYARMPENERLVEARKLVDEFLALPCACGGAPALCPNCHGQKTVLRPPWVAGDQPEWLGSGAPLFPCPTCDAKGYIILEGASE